MVRYICLQEDAGHCEWRVFKSISYVQFSHPNIKSQFHLRLQSTGTTYRNTTCIDQMFSLKSCTLATNVITLQLV